MTWVQPEEVLGYWIGPDAPEPSTLGPLIKGAEAIVKFYFPDLGDRLEDEDGLKDRLELVVSRMVIRTVKNPDQARAVQRGAGPFQETVTLGGTEPGTLWMTADERDLLAPISAGRNSGRAFTIDPAEHARNGTGPHHLDVCSVYFGGDCSCGAVLLGPYGWGWST